MDRLSELESMKQAAIDEEDYDRAKDLKRQIEKINSEINQPMDRDWRDSGERRKTEN